MCPHSLCCSCPLYLSFACRYVILTAVRFRVLSRSGRWSAGDEEADIRDDLDALADAEDQYGDDVRSFGNSPQWRSRVPATSAASTSSDTTPSAPSASVGRRARAEMDSEGGYDEEVDGMGSFDEGNDDDDDDLDALFSRDDALGGRGAAARYVDGQQLLEESLQDIYDDEQSRIAPTPFEVNPADFIMNDWPDVPDRQMILADLLDQAGVALDEANSPSPDDLTETEVLGLATDSRRVQPGDLFICLTGPRHDGHDFAQEACERGACAILSARPLPDVPAECPVLVVADPLSSLHDVANTFYDWPSFLLSTVGVTGTNGKTTSAWLIRSVLEQRGLVVGMVGTIEYAIAEDRLTEEGALWLPEEPDPTMQRACSAPYRIAPYRGKYTVPNTTPGPLSMVQLLAGMRDRGAQAAVVECSSQGIQTGRLDGTDIDVAVFTNLSQDHLDHHGSMDAYKEAKLALFRRLGDPAVALQAEIEALQEDAGVASERGAADADVQDETDSARRATSAAASVSSSDAAPGDRLAALEAQLGDWLARKRVVVNLDDPYVDEFRSAAGPVPCITFAVNDREADVWAEKVVKSVWESEIKIRIRLGDQQVRCQVVTPLIGQHNVYNVLAAIATGLALGIPLENIVAGIEAVEMVPGRVEVIDEGQGFPVIVDYAHTPEALSRLLDTVKECGAKRIITVVGCGGDRDKTKRPLMGEIAHYKSDLVFFTNDNPRTEEPNEILSEVVAGLPSKVKDRHAGSVFPWLQDRIRVPVRLASWTFEYIHDPRIQEC